MEEQEIPMEITVPVFPGNVEDISFINLLNASNDPQYYSSEADSNPSPMEHGIRVLLVDHDKRSLISTAKMLELCSCQVTMMELASKAMKMISTGKKGFDVVIADINSPDDMDGFQFCQEVVKLGILVLLTSAKEEPLLANKALENGAFLFIQKPANQHIMKYLWQFVMKKKLEENKREDKVGEVAWRMNGKSNGIRINEGGEGKNSTTGEVIKSQKRTRKTKNNGKEGDDQVNPSPQASDAESRPNKNINKKKICTEWTRELHEKFMDAVYQLGEGKCYPKEILEIMNVPGLTRMQVASHLQKCRHDNWRPPEERRYRTRNRGPSSTNREAKDKEKLRIFGSMPRPEDKAPAQTLQNPQPPKIILVPSASNSTTASNHEEVESARPENGTEIATACYNGNVQIPSPATASNDIEQFISMEMLDEDEIRFLVWETDLSLGLLNGISGPPPLPTTTDMVSSCLNNTDAAALENSLATAGELNVSPLPPQQTSDDSFAEFTDEMDYLIPDFPDFPLESGINNNNPAQTQTMCDPSDEVNPEQGQFANEMNMATGPEADLQQEIC